MTDNDQEIDYFKDKLYSNFKQAGLLDNLKTQMRFSIVEKLQKKEALRDTSNKENINTLNRTITSPLSLRLVISIVSEFLEKNGFNYSNAVFLPEAKHTSQTLTRSEIADILRLSHITKDDSDKPILNIVVDYIESLSKNKEARVNSSCQTDFEGRNVGLEEKLRNIDFEYFQKMDTDRITSQQSLEEKFNNFKREYDKRMKAEMSAEIARVKEFEITNIRLEEAEKYRHKMEQYREELDRAYMEKMQKLREREKETIERCKQQLKHLDDTSFNYRQNFLKEMEIYKMKEDEWNKQVELERENLKIQKDRVSNLEKELQRQLKDIEGQREEFRHRISDTKAATKVELMKEMENDRNTLYSLKSRLETEAGKLEQYKEAAENYEHQTKRLLEENAQVLDEVKQLREIKRQLEVELDKKRDQIEHLHSSLKKDENHMKMYDTQIQAYVEEVNHHKAAALEYKDMLEQRKREQIETNQRFIKEIEMYQEEIEKLERDRENLRKRILELENELAGAKYHTPGTDIAIQKDLSMTQHNTSKQQASMNASFSANAGLDSSLGLNDPIRRYNDLDRELQELKNKREKELMSYFLEPTNATSQLKRKSPAYIMQQPSPQFKTTLLEHQYGDRFAVNDFIPAPPLNLHSAELSQLERKKQDLKHDFNKFIEEDSKINEGTFRKQEPAVKKSTNPENFDKFFDSYADKMLEGGKSSAKKPLESEKKGAVLRIDDMDAGALKGSVHRGAASAFDPTKKSVEGTSVRDIFKIDSGKKGEDTDPSQHSLSLDHDPISDPKPIVFKKEQRNDLASSKDTRGHGVSLSSSQQQNKKHPAHSFGRPGEKTSEEEDEVDFDVIEDEDKLFL